MFKNLFDRIRGFFSTGNTYKENNNTTDITISSQHTSSKSISNTTTEENPMPKGRLKRLVFKTLQELNIPDLRIFWNISVPYSSTDMDKKLKFDFLCTTPYGIYCFNVHDVRSSIRGTIDSPTWDTIILGNASKIHNPIIKMREDTNLLAEFLNVDNNCVFGRIILNCDALYLDETVGNIIYYDNGLINNLYIEFEFNRKEYFSTKDLYYINTLIRDYGHMHL